MSSLKNQSQNNSVIVDNIVNARSFIERGVGLLGKKSFATNTAMWIQPSNNIHTLFMRFAIDVMFVDKKLIVKSIHRNVKPWHPLILSWGAHSVFEFKAGTLDQSSINIGDQLNVSD